MARHPARLLQRLVDTDSNSYDKAGVDAVGAVLTAALAEDGIEVARTPVTDFGDVLAAQVGPATGAAVLLLGHRDTVFPPGTVASRGFTQDAHQAYGPGVADMKGGLVASCFALRALKRAGELPFPVRVLYTGDEEIGSGTARPHLEAAARQAWAVLKLHALTDYERGITTNVGLIEGGTSSNTVAPSATARLDVRFVALADWPELQRRIEAIVAEVEVPGTSASITTTGLFLPMEEHLSRDLLALYQREAQGLGFSVEGEFTGGCADSGFTASLGVPTLCGLGPVGGKVHTDAEFLVLDTLVPRTQALVATILALAVKV